MRLPASSLRAALLGAVAVLVLPAVAHAGGQPATGSLTWTMPSASGGSWLAYVTAQGGTATASAGATATAGAFRYSVALNLTGAGSNYDPDNFAGLVEFQGTVTFTLPGTGQTVAITDPDVDLSRTFPNSNLSATGQGVSGAFGDSSPILHLDISHATWKNTGLSKQVVSGIVPLLWSGATIFPTDFPAPGTAAPFGTMTLSYNLPLEGLVTAQKGRRMTITTSPLNRPRRASTPVTVASPTSPGTVATGTLSRAGVLRLKLTSGTSTLAGNTWVLTVGATTTPVYLELSCDTRGPGCALPGAGTS